MASYEPAPESSSTRHDDQARAVRMITLVISVVFLLVGIAGFIPGITTNADDLDWAGHHSRAELLGIFQVSVLHNLIHLAYGIVGLLMSTTARRAATYLLVGGIVYAVVWLYGLLIDHNSDANFVPLNSADNWLHLILAIAMVGLGLWARKVSSDSRVSGAERRGRRGHGASSPRG